MVVDQVAFPSVNTSNPVEHATRLLPKALDLTTEDPEYKIKGYECIDEEEYAESRSIGLAIDEVRKMGPVDY